MIKISSDFDHGNIRCLSADNPGDIRLEIVEDTQAKFHQWFYYRVNNAASRPLVMKIVNAGTSSYVDGWKGYSACASYDGDSWFRVATRFEDGELTIQHTPDRDELYYAYFAAYPTTRYRKFVSHQIETSGFYHRVLGRTLDGQSIDYFCAGSGPLNFWIIARQHPGEDMGSWWMEGFFAALTDPENAAAQALLEQATVHIVPCMNLDGVARGHLRTNAAGVDLNRAWQNTTVEKSPEVYHVRERMRETGVDFFLDVHGDEAIPNNFLDSAKGIPGWDEDHETRFNRYSKLLLEESRDFQDKDGYPTAAPGKANLDIANSYVAQTWNCLSMTLEMPFKDAAVNPDPVFGWSPERCRSFAAAHVNVMAAYLRDA